MSISHLEQNEEQTNNTILTMATPQILESFVRWGAIVATVGGGGNNLCLCRKMMMKLMILMRLVPLT